MNLIQKLLPLLFPMDNIFADTIVQVIVGSLLGWLIGIACLGQADTGATGPLIGAGLYILFSWVVRFAHPNSTP